MSLYQDNLRNCSRFLPILICLDVLAQLGHDRAELEVKLAEVAVGLELCTQLIVLRLPVLCGLIAIFGGRCSNAVVLIEIIDVRGTFGCNCFSRVIILLT